MKKYLRYIYAILAVPLTIVLRYALLPLIGPGIPYITLFPVTVGVALIAGLGPAVLTGLFGSIIIDYLFLEPQNSWEFDVAQVTRTSVLVLTSVFVGYIGNALRAARARAEKQALALLESQHDLKHAQAVANVGSWRLDVQKNELTWSDEVYNIFDVPTGTPLTYESFLSYVHPDDRQYVDNNWKAALAGEQYDIEHRILINGQIKWVRERAELEIDKNGALLGGFGTVTDITRRKQIEDELRKSHYDLEIRVRERTAALDETVSELQKQVQQRITAEKTVEAERKRFEDVLEMMPAYAILLTPDYHVAYANRTFRDLFGDDNGQKCYEFLFHRTEPCEGCETYTVLKTNKLHFWEWTGPNGRNYDIYDYPFTDSDGSPLIMEIGVDVTAHKQAQNALAQNEGRYRSLTVATTQIVWTTNAKGEVTEDLPSWTSFTGQSKREIRGWGWASALHPDDREKTKAIWLRSVKTRSLYETEYRIRRHDGQYRYVFVRGVPVIEKDGSIREWVGTCTDITERKRAEIHARITNVLLELFAQKTTRKEYLDSVVNAIRDWSGCQCVGIRLTDSDGFIPYEAQIGFSSEFLATEGILSLKTDVCACMRIVIQKPEPQDEPVMTRKGSFRCDNTVEFFNSLPEKSKTRYRGYCLRHGFLSLAIVPIRYRDKVLGAIHLADKRKNKTSAETVEFLENMAMLIGEAVQRFDVEAELRLSESRLEEAQRIAHLGHWEWDIETDKLWWSDETYRIFGADRADFVPSYEAFLAFIHPHDREHVKQAVEDAIYKHKPYDLNHRIIRPDGGQRVIRETGEVAFNKAGKPAKMVGTVQDVTEEKQIENELRQSHHQLRLLTAQLSMVEEKERRRIASDLHDSVGQILAFASRELRSLKKSSPGRLAASMTDLCSKLDQAIQQTRSLSFDLSPSILYDLGLEVAIEDLAEKFCNERKMKCRFESIPGPKPLAEDVKILLYRAVRELLINIAKHAKAGTVGVSLARNGNEMLITVEDDGNGFDSGLLENGFVKPKGFGIFSIRERLGHVGGRMEIKSIRNKGTKVTLVAPLRTQQET
ncbi:MAG: PAS domain-containing protein [Sedimentisphaerales bacterium]|nr:PAS domain-containing protein [Sedimentisphaerales bacterium]